MPAATGVFVSLPEQGIELIRGRLLSSLPASRTAWLVSKPMLVVWLLVWIAMPVILAMRPDLAPSGKDGGPGPRPGGSADPGDAFLCAVTLLLDLPLLLSFVRDTVARLHSGPARWASGTAWCCSCLLPPISELSAW
jgi:hypothetical protein